MAIATLGSCGERNPIAESNPLLKKTNTPHDTPLFAEIGEEDYIPAFDYALEQARAETDAIINNRAKPTFANTIEALERSGADLNRVVTIFFSLNEAETSDRMQEIAMEMQPRMVEYSNDLNLNPVLFQRVKAVYDDRDNLKLDAEQAMLLEKTYKGFVRGGAGLNEADKERYRELSGKLSQLTLKFSQNVLAETNAFTLNIQPKDEKRIAELPAFVKESMAGEAKSRGQEGWTVTLQAAGMIPFMTYSSDRALKEQVWKKYNSRGMGGGDHDNRGIVKEIVDTRLAIANLLGYETYADYVLEERMARDVATVDSFLDELLTPTKPYAMKDVETIEKYARENLKYGRDFKMMPWDWSYLTEKYKAEKYAVNDEEIKPYLELEKVKQGIFLLANKLYGIKFVENRGIQVYHPDVVAYDVYEENGDFTGVLYMDFFPRASKRGGAWMTNYREMYTDAKGKEVRPLVTMVCNFTKPTETTPSLLTFDEFETFLHEFGHCLHGLFAEGKYASLTGTNVYRDFVELPSQLMENWATEKDFLDLFAVHYQTGAKIPHELVDKISAAKNYLAAYTNVRQVSFGIGDMAWHTVTEPVVADVEAFEKQAIAETQVLPGVPGTAMAPAFSHIFAGGYAAGYYSYKWAEVLEADAFSLFSEKGVFNREVARSFRENVLSKGGTEHPMKLYVAFRGHEPAVGALIEKMDLK